MIPHHKRLLTYALLAGLLFIAHRQALAIPFTSQYLFTEANGANIKVHIKTNLFSFTAKTEEFSGNLSLTENAPPVMKGSFYVKLATLDTDMELRNKHMRENYLEADRYPHAAFRLTEVAFEKGRVPKAGSTVEGTYKGVFSLHGIEKEIAGNGSLSVSGDGNEVTIKTEFPLKLSEFSIPQPSFKLVSVNDTVVIAVIAKGRADVLDQSKVQK